jgi:hypothetical protein
MSDAFADLVPGFYWIRFSDNDPEVARWDAEAQAWFLTGGEEGLGVEFAGDIVVISGRLAPG